MKKRIRNCSFYFILTVLSVLCTGLFSGCGGGIRINVHEAEETVPEETASDGRRVIEDRRKDFYTDPSLGEYTEIRLTDGASEILSGSADGVEISGDVIIFRKEGTYMLSGKLTDGMLYVSTEKESDVRLVLNGVRISGKKRAPLYVECADKCILSLMPGTENYFSDKVTGSVNGETLTAAIYSKEDLVINGSGSLTVAAEAKDGITSKDTLKIMEGKLEVTAADDALYGKDELIIRNGEIRITTGGGAVQAPEENQDQGFFGGDEDESLSLPSGGQGLKSMEYIGIDSGRITADCAGDALHTEGDIYILGGHHVLRTGDDGIHAGGRFQLNGGEVTVAESVEGCEAGLIVINGGILDVSALDDGLNASLSEFVGTEAAEEETRAQESSSEESQAQEDTTEKTQTQEKAAILMNGGRVTVNAVCDGMDSNGDISLKGGTLLMSGPGHEGSVFLSAAYRLEVDGTELLFAGYQGFPAAGEGYGKQQLLTLEVPSGSAGDEICIQDAAGESLLSMTAAGEYTALLLSSPSFQAGDVLTLFINGKVKEEITVTDVILSEERYE